MDPNSLMAAFASMDIARKAVGAAINIRDFNKAATELAKLNEALLNSQSQAFQLMGSLLTIQGEKADLTKQVKELQEAALERQRYTLFELSAGVYVYRSNVESQGESGAQPSRLEPSHYICQSCFDNDGHRIVLQRSGPNLVCRGCKGVFWTGERMTSGFAITGDSDF